MIFKYGSFSHPVNDVQFARLDRRRRYSPRSRRRTSTNTLTIRGRVKIDAGAVDPTGDMRTLINQLEGNYLTDPLSVGLYHNDGSPTAHVLDSAGSMDGIRVLNFGYDAPAGGAEYTIIRSFYAVMQVDYLHIESEIIDFREKIETVGSGGPRRTLDGNLNPIIIQNSTPVMVVQDGYVVGLQGWPEVRVPQPYWPQYELSEDRRITRVGGDSHRLLITDRRISWQYVFLLPQWALTYPAEY